MGAISTGGIEMSKNKKATPQKPQSLEELFYERWMEDAKLVSDRRVALATCTAPSAAKPAKKK